MVRTMKNIVPVLLAALFFCSGCSFARAAETDEPLLCREAEDWNALFDRRGRLTPGWLAADGIYTVKTEENKTVFIFSDTLIGKSDEKGKPKNAAMANHSAAVLRGTQPLLQHMTYYFGANGARWDTGNLFGGRYWLFDCVYLSHTLYILAFEPSETWKPLNVRLISVPVVNGTPDFSRYSVQEASPALCRWTADGSYCYAFGQGITDNSQIDGYVYIYGYKDPLQSFESRDLLVSRIKAEDFGDFTKLRYWNGEDWCNEIEYAADIAENVSCEMSCTRIADGPLKGKYILVYMHACNSGDLMYALGDSPIGPFSKPVIFYSAPENGQPAANGMDTLYTYNAKAHPALSPEGALLVSYNVNSSGEQYTTDYHPRFIYLSLTPGEEPGPQRTVSLLRAFLQKVLRFILRFSKRH